MSDGATPDFRIYLVEGGARTEVMNPDESRVYRESGAALGKTEVLSILDSTATGGIYEGSPKRVEVDIRPGLHSEDVSVAFSGSSSRFFEMTLTDPASQTPPVYSASLSGLTLDGRAGAQANTRIVLFIRATASPGEAAVEDRSTSLVVSGRVRAS